MKKFVKILSENLTREQEATYRQTFLFHPDSPSGGWYKIKKLIRKSDELEICYLTFL